jgi:hypothetical protein
LRSYLKEKVAAPVKKTEITAVGDPTHLFPQKLALTSPISGSPLVSIVRSRTQATEFFFPLTGLSVGYIPLLQAKAC